MTWLTCHLSHQMILINGDEIGFKISYCLEELKSNYTKVAGKTSFKKRILPVLLVIGLT